MSLITHLSLQNTTHWVDFDVFGESCGGNGVAFCAVVLNFISNSDEQCIGMIQTHPDLLVTHCVIPTAQVMEVLGVGVLR